MAEVHITKTFRIALPSYLMEKLTAMHNPNGYISETLVARLFNRISYEKNSYTIEHRLDEIDTHLGKICDALELERTGALDDKLTGLCNEVITRESSIDKAKENEPIIEDAITDV